jgi:hypothetical protein
MEHQRREFLKSFASMGAVGASTLAAVACGRAGAPQNGVPTAGGARQAATSLHGRGPALQGPYLDLSTGRGNQLAYARLQGDIDFGKQKYFWFKGYVMGVRPMKKIDDLMGCQGFGAIRLVERPDGAIERLCREVILYTDIRSGEVIEEWDNPYTSETVKVVQVANDPFNYLIEEHFPTPPEFGGLNEDKPPEKIPFILPWYQHGPWAEMEVHIHLLYPNALQPDKWPRESSGPMVQVSEFFAHHVSPEDLQNPDVTSLDYTGTWNRTTPWLPWMLMGQTPGHCSYACFFGKTENLEQVLTRSVLDHVEKNNPTYFDAPTEWSEPSLSSLEHYAEQQEPVAL